MPNIGLDVCRESLAGLMAKGVRTCTALGRNLRENCLSVAIEARLWLI